MRAGTILAILCAFPVAASAQTTECRTVPKSTDRLACYDRLAPPVAAQRSTATPAAQPTDRQPAAATSNAPLADVLAIENSKLDAKIKTICRGC
jgi:hypothetical protein